jgi:hypothetical protein
MAEKPADTTNTQEVAVEEQAPRRGSKVTRRERSRMAEKPADTTNTQEVAVEEQAPGTISKVMRVAQGKIAIEDKADQPVAKVPLALGVVALLATPAVLGFGTIASLVTSKTVAVGAISALATRYYYKRKSGE